MLKIPKHLYRVSTDGHIFKFTLISKHKTKYQPNCYWYRAEGRADAKLVDIVFLRSNTIENYFDNLKEAVEKSRALREFENKEIERQIKELSEGL